ncbi:hypothetical protein KP509_22G007500 [Ceratopteris richardii]|uniref:Uncharacterized protein n=1 Tax=Ceratopteris richardii TaxID=49495 RepID=A0A8T2S2I5_CERRI|nr:hypothetical protein KP509_22G007500 [Ceratopteris richardii]
MHDRLITEGSHSPLGKLAEKWKMPVQRCIAGMTRQLHNSPLWEELSKWPCCFLQQNGFSAIMKSANAAFSTSSSFPNFRPPMACLSSDRPSHPADDKHFSRPVFSREDISEKLEGIPVYTVCKKSSELVLVSDAKNQKSMGFFCFRMKDAESLLQQVQAKQPHTGKGAKVVAISLNKVYNLQVEGISFRLLPDPHQVGNALQGIKDLEKQSFSGVPIFQSNTLIIRSKDTHFRPVFFNKEDLQQALESASKLQQKINPSLQLNTDIQVSSFEHALKQMEGSFNVQEWGDVVFIPPGMTALSQLEGNNKTMMS